MRAVTNFNKALLNFDIYWRKFVLRQRPFEERQRYTDTAANTGKVKRYIMRQNRNVY